MWWQPDSSLKDIYNTYNLRKIFNKPKEGEETEMTLEHVILYKLSSFQAFMLEQVLIHFAQLF